MGDPFAATDMMQRDLIESVHAWNGIIGSFDEILAVSRGELVAEAAVIEHARRIPTSALLTRMYLEVGDILKCYAG